MADLPVLPAERAKDAVSFRRARREFPRAPPVPCYSNRAMTGADESNEG